MRDRNRVREDMAAISVPMVFAAGNQSAQIERGRRKKVAVEVGIKKGGSHTSRDATATGVADPCKK
jgi:hypothetical protein